MEETLPEGYEGDVTQCARDQRADCANVVALEHVNINIEDQSLSQEFYAEGLGLTRDPYRRVSGRGTMWINVGSQQVCPCVWSHLCSRCVCFYV